MEIVKRFIPTQFQNNPKILRSLSLIILVNLLIALSAIIIAGIFYRIGFIQGSYILGYTFLASNGYFIVLNYSKNLKSVGIYFMVQSLIIANALIFYTGGSSSPFIFWLFGIGPIGYLYFKSNLAALWTSIAMLSFIFFAILQMSGYVLTQHLPSAYYNGIWVFMFCFLSYIFLAMVRGFQNGLKKINFKLKQSNNKLQVSNEELERFAYIASHDLKSPLRNITSFIKLFNRRYSKSVDGDGLEYLDIIYKNAEQMHHLIEDILEYSKSNNNKVKREFVNMNHVFLDIKQQLQMEEKYQRSLIELPELPLINADPTQMKQIFTNLIENGLKYNKSFRKKITVHYHTTFEGIEFIVKDNGIGMSEDYYDRIFEMFKRLHTQDEFNGTGIGLAICKKLVQLHGGTIQVESILGEGSTFKIQFPKSILRSEVETISLKEIALAV